jgi:hypothetical protein
MDNLMVFDDKQKKKIGIVSLIPNIALFICLVYYLFLIVPVAGFHTPPASAVGVTHAHYDTLFVMLAIYAIIAAGVLIYNLVMLARMKNMNAAEKAVWVLLLVGFVPLSFLVFWYFVVKKEPRYVGAYPDIA